MPANTIWTWLVKTTRAFKCSISSHILEQLCLWKMNNLCYDFWQNWLKEEDWRPLLIKYACSYSFMVGQHKVSNAKASKRFPSVILQIQTTISLPSLNTYVHSPATWEQFPFLFPPAGLLSTPENSCLSMYWPNSKSSLTFVCPFLFGTCEFLPNPFLFISQHAQMSPRFFCVHLCMVPLAKVTITPCVIKGSSKYCIKFWSGTTVDCSMFNSKVSMLHTYALTELFYITFKIIFK